MRRACGGGLTKRGEKSRLFPLWGDECPCPRFPYRSVTEWTGMKRPWGVVHEVAAALDLVDAVVDQALDILGALASVFRVALEQLPFPLSAALRQAASASPVNTCDRTDVLNQNALQQQSFSMAICMQQRVGKQVRCSHTSADVPMPNAVARPNGHRTFDS